MKTGQSNRVAWKNKDMYVVFFMNDVRTSIDTSANLCETCFVRRQHLTRMVTRICVCPPSDLWCKYTFHQAFERRRDGHTPYSSLSLHGCGACGVCNHTACRSPHQRHGHAISFIQIDPQRDTVYGVRSRLSAKRDEASVARWGAFQDGPTCLRQPMGGQSTVPDGNTSVTRR